MTDLSNGVDDATIAAIRSARRVCFFAHYHPHGIAADHVLFYLAALKSAGFSVVVLSTATMDPAEQAKLRAACSVLIMRENQGLDFGGWMEATALFFPLQAEFLLLANDSVYGPVFDLGTFIDRLTATPADFYGAIESYEDGPHLQSWFLLLRPSAYNSAAFGRLMTTPIPPTMSKRTIIQTYELGISRALVEDGLTFRAAYSPEDRSALIRERAFNPMHLFWVDLLSRRAVPFIKIELLRDNPMHLAGLERWRRIVGRLAPPLAPMIQKDLERRRTYTPLSLTRRLFGSRRNRLTLAWSFQWRLQALSHRYNNAIVNRFSAKGFQLIERIEAYVKARASR